MCCLYVAVMGCNQRGVSTLPSTPPYEGCSCELFNVSAVDAKPRCNSGKWVFLVSPSYHVELAEIVGGYHELPVSLGGNGFWNVGDLPRFLLPPVFPHYQPSCGSIRTVVVFYHGPRNTQPGLNASRRSANTLQCAAYRDVKTPWHYSSYRYKAVKYQLRG
jgi:hypothetical protein